jgi:hypothetical protein
MDDDDLEVIVLDAVGVALKYRISMGLERE